MIKKISIGIGIFLFIGFSVFYYIQHLKPRMESAVGESITRQDKIIVSITYKKGTEIDQGILSKVENEEHIKSVLKGEGNNTYYEKGTSHISSIETKLFRGKGTILITLNIELSSAFRTNSVKEAQDIADLFVDDHDVEHVTIKMPKELENKK